MAICLATMLLVIISTVGNGVIHLQKSQAAGSYGSNYGLFVSADGSQLKEVNRRAEIDATGTMCTEGIIKGNEKGGFVCMDETARKMLPYNKEYELKEGKYPEKMQEIAAGRAFFRAMGYGDVKIGDTVTLDYRAGMQSEYKPEEFVVSGILYDRDEYTIEASYVAFGSQEFYDEHVAENDRQYNIYFTLNDSANVSMNNIDSVIKQIAAACGIEEKNVIVNDLYLQWVLQPSYETIAVCGVLILAIVLFSVVVIYNIFQVGIANKIQEYGKIKALGATKKQMKQLIFREGIFLTIFSIPVGLLFGFLIAKCGFNWLVEQGNLVSTQTGSMEVQNQQVPLFSLPVMLLCIFVSFLVGKSGSGKSTLLHMLGGLDTPTKGRVTLAGKDLYRMKEDALAVFRRRKIGFVFQAFNLVSSVNVWENIVLPLGLDGRKVDEAYVNDIIATLGIKNRIYNLPNQLSGGQQQRVAIARALVNRPEIIFADEPTGNLDSKTSDEVIALLKMTAKKYGQTIVMITHDDEIAQVADRILVIEDGQVVDFR